MVPNFSFRPCPSTTGARSLFLYTRVVISSIRASRMADTFVSLPGVRVSPLWGSELSLWAFRSCVVACLECPDSPGSLSL